MVIIRSSGFQFIWSSGFGCQTQPTLGLWDTVIETVLQIVFSTHWHFLREWWKLQWDVDRWKCSCQCRPAGKFSLSMSTEKTNKIVIFYWSMSTGCTFLYSQCWWTLQEKPKLPPFHGPQRGNIAGPKSTQRSQGSPAGLKVDIRIQI